jgi:nucleoside-diphosphate-sugar epimerase
MSDRAAGRIYNLAETESFPEMEWAQRIAQSVEWTGEVISVPPDLTPAHLRLPYNSAQHWIMSSVRIREELGYCEPVPPDTALASTIEWERANPPPQIDPNQFNYAAEDEALQKLRGHFAG